MCEILNHIYRKLLFLLIEFVPCGDLCNPFYPQAFVCKHFYPQVLKTVQFSEARLQVMGWLEPTLEWAEKWTKVAINYS